MTKRDPLTGEQVEEALRELIGWRFENDSLRKRFALESFRSAISFMVRLAFEAEELNHHPDLRNVYNTVDVTLTTHDAGNKVTKMDVELARAIEKFSWV